MRCKLGPYILDKFLWMATMSSTRKKDVNLPLPKHRIVNTAENDVETRLRLLGNEAAGATNIVDGTWVGFYALTSRYKAPLTTIANHWSSFYFERLFDSQKAARAPGSTFINDM